MGSTQHLAGLGLIASGCIRILAAYVLFIALTRLSSRSRTRHALWLIFLIGAGFYWATLLAQIFQPQSPSDVAARSVAADHPATGNGATSTVTIPIAWNYRMELASGFLVCGYVGGVMLMFFRLTRHRRSLRQAVSKARPVSPQLDRTFEHECRRLGISRCRILELPGLSSPGTAYIWKPVILIPEDLDSCLDSEQLIDVLYHELMHVRRLDFLWGTLGDVVSCLWFFHPAVWLAVRNLSRERELACDGAVMELRGGRRADYASCLARLARRRVLGRQLDPPSHLALLNSFLAFRVRTLLGEDRPRSRGMQKLGISAALVALCGFFAGWSSLSLAIEFAPPLPVSARLAAPAGHSAASLRMVARHGKPPARSAGTRLPVSTPPAVSGIPSDPDVIVSLPPSDAVSSDAWTVSPQVESGGALPEPYDRSTWDEAPASKPVVSLPSWRRAVIDAAIGVLGRVSQGRRPDDRDSTSASQH
jgi:beta-lactamase regulating signal transducer with metallopeptidase domain